MTQENNTANAVATVTEQNKVTQQLLMDYLKQTNSNLQPNEQAQFLAIAQTFNLNPWKREVYAVAYGKGDGRKLSIIVGYEVYLRRAEEFPQYDGYETSFIGTGSDMCCTCKVFRKDRNHATGATVFLREYSQGNSMWNTKPRVMLEKVAIATAMRRAFPSEFNGMPYIADELPDNMTGADRLNAQGLTEAVPSEAEARTLTPFQTFSARLKEMNAEDDEAFALVKEEMKKEGWLKPSDVPEAQYNRVEAWFANAKAQMIAEQEAENG